MAALSHVFLWADFTQPVWQLSQEQDMLKFFFHLSVQIIFLSDSVTLHMVLKRSRQPFWPVLSVILPASISSSTEAYVPSLHLTTYFSVPKACKHFLP